MHARQHGKEYIGRCSLEEKNEHEEDISLSDSLGLHGNALRVQLRGSTGQIESGCAYWYANSDNSHDPSDYTSDYASDYASGHSSDNTADHASNHAADYSSSRRSGPCSYPATGDGREAESRHPSRSGRVDDLIEFDAHQSSTRNPPEHRQRPVHRRIG
jgi:hypothetical protein